MVETGYAMGTTQLTRALFVVDRRDGEGVEGQRIDQGFRGSTGMGDDRQVRFGGGQGPSCSRGI